MYVSVHPECIHGQWNGIYVIHWPYWMDISKPVAIAFDGTFRLGYLWLPSHSIKYSMRPSIDKRLPLTLKFSPFVKQLVISKCWSSVICLDVDAVSLLTLSIVAVVALLFAVVVAVELVAIVVVFEDGTWSKLVVRRTSSQTALLLLIDIGLFANRDDRMAAIEMFFESPRIGRNALVFGKSCNGTVLITYETREERERDQNIDMYIYK